MNAWPMIAACKARQWAGLTEIQQRAIAECLERGRVDEANAIESLSGQSHKVIWATASPRKELVVLVGVKEDLA